LGVALLAGQARRGKQRLPVVGVAGAALRLAQDDEQPNYFPRK
jgi:hypothetical protein